MAPQFRRFRASCFTQPSIEECFGRLKQLDFITYVCRNNTEIYFETNLKKTVGSLKCRLGIVPNLEDVRYNAIVPAEHVELHGRPMSQTMAPQVPFDPLHFNATSIYEHVRFYKAKPNLEEIVLVGTKKIECDAGLSAGKFKNEREEYSLKLYPWQNQAMLLLDSQSDREVLWIFDKNGNSGKTELLKYLEYNQGYQYLVGGAPRDLGSMLDCEVNGYCIDLVRVGEKKYAGVFALVEQIKNGRVQSGKYTGTNKLLASSKVAIVANFMPNLATLSLDRWVIFHTKLGSIQLNCEPHGDKGYKCTISHKMQNSVSEVFAHQCDGSARDAELYKQYIESHSAGLHIFYSNPLAFPKIAGIHKGAVRRLVQAAEFDKLQRYVKNYQLLDDSIADDDCFISFVGNTGKTFVGCERTQAVGYNDSDSSVQSDDNSQQHASLEFAMKECALSQIDKSKSLEVVPEILSEDNMEPEADDVFGAPYTENTFANWNTAAAAALLPAGNNAAKTVSPTASHGDKDEVAANSVVADTSTGLTRYDVSPSKGRRPRRPAPY